MGGAATMHDCEHTSIYCDTFNCSNNSRYYVGHPDVPHIGTKICEECAINIVRNLPQELFQHLPIEAYGVKTEEIEVDGEKLIAVTADPLGVINTDLTDEEVNELIEAIDQSLSVSDAVALQIDSEPEFTCEQCDKSFKSHKGLLSHEKQVHGKK